MKIHLSKEALKNRQSIETFLKNEERFNANYSGITFEIVEDEFCWIPDHKNKDEINDSFLLQKIITLSEEV